MSHNEIMSSRKEYHKEYRRKNKDKLNEYQKEYRRNNKERIKEHYENNKDKIKEWDQSPTGLKSKRIQNWKKRGVIHDDFNELYEKYINTEFCEECNCKLTVDKTITSTTRCLDHDHTTGEFRNVICHSCNTKRG